VDTAPEENRALDDASAPDEDSARDDDSAPEEQESGDEAVATGEPLGEPARERPSGDGVAHPMRLPNAAAAMMAMVMGRLRVIRVGIHVRRSVVVIGSTVTISRISATSSRFMSRRFISNSLVDSSFVSSGVQLDPKIENTATHLLWSQRGQRRGMAVMPRLLRRTHQKVTKLARMAAGHREFMPTHNDDVTAAVRSQLGDELQLHQVRPVDAHETRVAPPLRQARQ
jgi:hypothetical protein